VLSFRAAASFVISSGSEFCHFERQRVLSFRAAASFVISSGSEFCHFERQREIFNKQDSSSLLLLGMTTAKASKIILNILEFLRSQPGGGVGDA
ncbi:MAG: hypothetical protein KGY61_13150, partial [Desulfobacterales bacterium]|nr:hypothetical protein [Desulfobacterales bacterium]